MALSLFVWAMTGVACWHLSVSSRTGSGVAIIGAFLAAAAGALGPGFLLPRPGIPAANRPGLGAALSATPGALFALAASYDCGVGNDRANRIERD